MTFGFGAVALVAGAGIGLVLWRELSATAAAVSTPDSSGSSAPIDLAGTPLDSLPLPFADVALPDVPTSGLLPGVDGVDLLAHAIARAEGFGVPGSAPTRGHNPGALKQPWLNYPVTGAEGITVYPSDEAGWAALRAQLTLIATSQSQVYDLTDAIGDMARKWTDTDGAAWAANVVAYLNANGLNVGSDTPLAVVLG